MSSLASSSGEVPRLRLTRHYAEKLRKASVATRHGSRSHVSWLRVIDQDWEQIKHSQAWSSSGDAYDVDRDRLCTAFILSTGSILQWKLTPAEQLEWAQEGLTSATRLGDGQAMRTLLYQVIMLNLTLEVLEGVDEQVAQLMRWAEQAGDKLTQGRAWYVMGMADFIRGNYDRTHECFSRSLALLQARRAANEIPIVFRGLGRVAQYRGEIEQAHKYYYAYLEAATAINSEHAVLLAHVSLSGILLATRDYEIAAYHAQLAVDIAQTFGMTRILPPAMLSLAHAKKWLGSYEEACQHYDKGITAARVFGSPSSISNGLHGLGQAHYFQGNPAAALPPLKEAITIAREANLPLRVCEIAHDMVHVHIALGDLEPAWALLQEATTISLRLAKAPFYAKSLAAALMLWQADGYLEQAAVWAGTLATIEKNLHPTVFDLRALDVLENTLGSEHYREAIHQGKSYSPESVVTEILSALQERSYKS